jgi:23S rRNA pseudouridine1911/1915/1917 synthase
MLDILYEDDDLIAVSKPAGQTTQAPAIAGQETLEWEVRRHLSPDDPAAAYVGTVHRLDRPVSGIVLWAKTRRAARVLARQFERRQAHKEYWAVVEGRLRQAEGVWDDWLVREDTGLGRVQVCARGTPRSQRAITRYRLATAQSLPPGCSWLILSPETGRMHQLRVQAASRGLPILGDRLYGSTRPFLEGAIALHAHKLIVRHPGDGRVLMIVAREPRRWHESGIVLTSPY